jgi:hypothetical protein
MFFILFTLTGYTQRKNELVKEKDEALREINLTNQLLKKTERERKTSLNQLILLTGN